jgi:hypothetical protein
MLRSALVSCWAPLQVLNPTGVAYQFSWEHAGQQQEQGQQRGQRQAPPFGCSTRSGVISGEWVQQQPVLEAAAVSLSSR